MQPCKHDASPVHAGLHYRNIAACALASELHMQAREIFSASPICTAGLILSARIRRQNGKMPGGRSSTSMCLIWGEGIRQHANCAELCPN